MPGERHSYLLTLTEGPWNDWFVSVSVADERGRRIALVVKDDDMPLATLLSLLLAEAEDAIVRDFLARRIDPSWIEERRRSLICRLLWVRNLRFRR